MQGSARRAHDAGSAPEDCAAPEVDSARRAQPAALGYAATDAPGDLVHARLALPPP